MKRLHYILGSTVALLLTGAIFATAPASAALMMSFDRLTLGGAPTGDPVTIVNDEVLAEDGKFGVLGQLEAIRPPAGGGGTVAPVIDGFKINTGRVTSISTTSLPKYDLLYNITNETGAMARYQIAVTETDLGDVGAINTFLSRASANGTGFGGSFYMDTYFDTSNAAFGQGTSLASFGPGSALNYSDFTVDAAIGLTAPYSMTLVMTVDLPAGKFVGGNLTLEKNEGSGETPVPEPSTFVLGAVGLIALGLCTRRKKAPK